MIELMSFEGSWGTPGGATYISYSSFKGIYTGAYTVTIRLHDCIPKVGTIMGILASQTSAEDICTLQAPYTRQMPNTWVGTQTCLSSSNWPKLGEFEGGVGPN